MGKWEMVRLGDVASFNMGQSPSSESYNNTGEGLPFFQGKTDFGLIYPTARIYCTDPKKLAEKNDILISVRAPVGAVNIATETCCIGRGLAAISQKEKISDYKYIYYYLQYKENDIASMGVGSTFKAISKKDLGIIEIPLPPLPIQQKIADVLDRASALIEKRKAQIEKLALLVKSQFIEMFGDPVTNPMGWEVAPIIDFCDCMVPGRDKPKSFTGDIPWITIDDLIVNGITYDSKKKMGLSVFEMEQVKRKSIPAGSVIMSCVGLLGIVSIAGSDVVINQQLHSFQCKKKVINVFIMYELGWQKTYMEKMANSTTLPYMNKSVCNSIPMRVPPLALQTQFAAFVERVEAQKARMKQGLELMKLEYKSLMQKCFNGETSPVSSPSQLR